MAVDVFGFLAAGRAGAHSATGTERLGPLFADVLVADAVEDEDEETLESHTQNE